MSSDQLVSSDTMNSPWGLESRFMLVMSAVRFFDIGNNSANHEIISKRLPKTGGVALLTVKDFLRYLKVRKIYPKTPNAFRVAQIVKHMESVGLLVSVGSRDSSVGGLGDQYLHMPLESEARQHLFRLVPALGPEFLYNICAPGLVHISGTSDAGNETAGTGLIIDTSCVLTCRHVVADMTVKERQMFQAREYSIRSIHEHPDVDAAVIRVDGPELSPCQGILFQDPVVGRTVYTLGYPKLPGLREASVTMQQGVVTNESVTSLSGGKPVPVFCDLQTRE